jgi:hypothetical protein
LQLVANRREIVIPPAVFEQSGPIVAEKQEAEREAWTAPGVTAVDTRFTMASESQRVRRLCAFQPWGRLAVSAAVRWSRPLSARR